MSKQAKMERLYGAPVEVNNMHYIMHGNGDVEFIEESDVDAFHDNHPNEDYNIIAVDEGVVEFIEDSSSKNPDNYDRPGLTVGDMKALAFMHNNMGELYCEVLRSYTHFVQDGMRVETAVYAAMLAWDLSIDGVQS